MVGFDSIVPPGRAGKIKPAVTIKGMHGGNFHKGITVISNAENTPTLRLGIRGKILPIIGIEPGYMRIKSDDQSKRITLSSEFKKLKVKEISFKSRNRGQGPTWQSQAPIYLKFAVTPVDSMTEDGYHQWHIDLRLESGPSETQHGDFVIKTNHAKKPEITIRGAVESR